MQILPHSYDHTFEPQGHDDVVVLASNDLPHATVFLVQPAYRPPGYLSKTERKSLSY